MGLKELLKESASVPLKYLFLLMALAPIIWTVEFELGWIPGERAAGALFGFYLMGLYVMGNALIDIRKRTKALREAENGA
jgi:hypothetical protein